MNNDETKQAQSVIDAVKNGTGELSGRLLNGRLRAFMTMKTPLDELPFPVTCGYCEAGPFNTTNEVDEHVTEEHLPEAVWSFATDHMRAGRL